MKRDTGQNGDVIKTLKTPYWECPLNQSKPFFQIAPTLLACQHRAHWSPSSNWKIEFRHKTVERQTYGLFIAARISAALVSVFDRVYFLERRVLVTSWRSSPSSVVSPHKTLRRCSRSFRRILLSRRAYYSFWNKLDYQTLPLLHHRPSQRRDPASDHSLRSFQLWSVGSEL